MVCGLVNDGELVASDDAVMNGEIVGSPTNVDVPMVSTVRVGSLECLQDRFSASSSSLS